jgi:hypothetical protein
MIWDALSRGKFWNFSCCPFQGWGGLVGDGIIFGFFGLVCVVLMWVDEGNIDRDPRRGLYIVLSVIGLVVALMFSYLIFFLECDGWFLDMLWVVGLGVVGRNERMKGNLIYWIFNFWQKS